jgi:hypothetical protein
MTCQWALASRPRQQQHQRHARRRLLRQSAAALPLMRQQGHVYQQIWRANSSLWWSGQRCGGGGASCRFPCKQWRGGTGAGHC